MGEDQPWAQKAGGAGLDPSTLAAGWQGGPPLGAPSGAMEILCTGPMGNWSEFLKGAGCEALVSTAPLYITY